MNQTVINILENIWVGALGLFLLIFSGLGVWHISSSSTDTPLTMHHSDILSDHNERLLKLDDLPSRLNATDINIKNMQSDVETMIHESQIKSNARIYNLEITLCTFDETTDEVHKRKVIMNDIIAINPSVERTATVVDTGLGYGLAQVEIPTISDSEDEYACGLKILSIK